MKKTLTGLALILLLVIVGLIIWVNPYLSEKVLGYPKDYNGCVTKGGKVIKGVQDSCKFRGKVYLGVWH